MPRLERSGLENRRQFWHGARRVRPASRRRNGAVADGAADQTIAFVGELDAIVLQMDMDAHGTRPAGEVERRLGDGKGVAGIEADADAARLLAKSASSSLPKS